MHLLGTLPLLLLQAASVSPPSVPARGRQEAIVTLDRAGMVHLSARSRRGTSCTLVDHLRGPFTSSGVAGRSNCEVDLLLDSGTYQLRLESARKGKGRAQLAVTPFSELNEKAPVLEPHRIIEQDVGPGRQASYWIKLDRRQPIALHVTGRTAGQVLVWRGGEWLEDLPFREGERATGPGQPVHEWWLESMLEPGEYRVVVYGTNVRAWTRGRESNLVSVSLGFEPAPAERAVTLALPASGFFAYELPKGTVAAFASLHGSATQATEVSIHELDGDGLSHLDSQGGRCRIEPKALVPECLATTRSPSRHVLAVHGVPGTPVALQWGTYGEGRLWASGEYRRPPRQLDFTPPTSGQYLLATHDIPADQDSAPLGCTLEQLVDGNPLERGRDLLAISPTRPLSRAFNYDGREAHVFFEVLEADRYQVNTGVERKSRCELFRLGDGKGERLTETGATGCRLLRALPPGTYQLSLYGGTPGIEKLTIARQGAPVPDKTPTKSSCLLPSVTLEAKAHYRLTLNRTGDVSARGLILRPLPLALDEPLPVVLDGGATVRLSVTAGRALRVRGTGSPAFSCALGSGVSAEARDGVCELPEVAAKDTLVLTSRSPEAASLSVWRPPPPPAASRAPPSPFVPTPSALPALPLERAVFLDFERGQSHSLGFEVKRAGLYHVTTEGLLATECRVRTPVVALLGSDSGGGRGRNCLLASYLRPGRYLVTVKTVGPSRGRGAVVMTRRAARGVQDVTADGEAFFRAAAGELIQQQLTVPKSGRYQLGTTGQGVSLQCRLDDRKGWPLVPVPTPCESTQLLAAGTYLWTQLPLTVESMRHTRLAKVKPPVVLAGNTVHAIALDTWYDARLGKDGQDEFTFTLEAPLEVTFSLTQKMQGRLYAVTSGTAPRPVEVIAPQEERAARPTYRGRALQAEPSEEGEESGEGGEVGEEEEAPPESVLEQEGGEEREEPYEEPAAPSAPAGQTVALEPGQYKLVTEHSRGDVAISYRLHLAASVLIPGVTQELAVPGRYTLRMPQDGVLRLRTEGEADVRCRLLAGGRLLYESSENGDDWNCALAEPLAKGDYTLSLEAQTQLAGKTRVSVSTPQVEDLPALANEQTLELGAGVKVAPLPEVPADSVQELAFSSRTRFSCALEDQTGVLRQRQAGVKECAFLLREPGGRHRVRLWTTGEPARLSVRYAARPVVPVAWGKVAAGSAGLARLERAGLYTTGEGVFCLPESERGLLRPCGPQVSLAQGGVLFSTLGPNAEAKVPLDERVAELAQPLRQERTLTRTPFIQRGRSGANTLHLLGVTVPHGERSSPACELAGGAREQRDASCFAAAGPTSESVASLWTASEGAVQAETYRLAVPLPSASTPLARGPQTLSWTGPAVRLALPAEPSSVELTLAKEAWAVRLDSSGAARDVCAPSPGGLGHCLLRGQGGELIIYSPGEARADATVVLTGAPARTLTLAGLFEEHPAREGHLRFTLASAGQERRLEVEGALHCVLELADGRRVSGCRATVPAGVAAQLEVDHAAAPLRALLFAPSERGRALLSVSPPGQPPANLEHAQAALLSGMLVDRAFRVEQPSGVRLEATAGVCALLGPGGEVLEASGLGLGCEVHRTLAAGTYRVLVRAFAGQPLSGTLAWTAAPLFELAEGVGAEHWLAPGQARRFRFTTRSRGHVGLGLQAPSDRLECTLEDESGRPLGDGCQQYLALDAGTYVLEVRAPRDGGALGFKPVLLGLAGSKMDVPPEYLEDFFKRIGAQP